MIEIIWCPLCQKAARISKYEQMDDDPCLCEWKKADCCVRDDHREVRMVLTVLASSFISNKPNMEFVKTAYFYAKDENDKIWVVKEWRESIEESCWYEVFEGRIDTEIAALAVQKNNIIKQLLADAQKAALKITDQQIELLVCYLENQLKFDRFQKRLKPKDIFVSDEHPLIISVRLPDWLADSLYEFCQKFFLDKEFIRDFIGREKGQDGVLAFVGRRQFEVIYY